MDDEQITMDTLKQREGDQPLPVPTGGEYIQHLVMEDLRKRMELGIQRYGVPLQAFNGRDVLQDIYEELLDAACYVKQAMVERDTKRPVELLSRTSSGETQRETSTP